LLNRITNGEECDATEADSSNVADSIKRKQESVKLTTKKR